MPITIESLPISSCPDPKLEIWHIIEDGVSAVAEFIFGLQLQDRNKLLGLLRRCAESGLPRSEERFKSLTGYTNLYELKTFGVRVFCMIDGSRLVLLEACRKKSDRATSSTRASMERAERRKALYTAAKQNR